MICSFSCKKTEALFNGKRAKEFQGFTQQAERRLQILDSATRVQDLAGLPSNHFEALLGDRKGQYSIRINPQWRVCFKWGVDGPFDVEIVDYH